jgi:sigma-B regulation protein RsbU (phosphoserine phosphatase)
MQRLISVAGNLLVVIGRDISERKKLDEAKAALHENVKRHHLELRNEMMLASEMHLRFLPNPGCINGVCFDWLFRASGYLGGDIFDYFPLDERYLCFHLIDVSGHNVSAALVAFNAQREIFSGRPEILAFIHRMNGDIARAASMTVESFNRKFAAITKSSLYLTMIFGIVDTWTGEMALVQAGHPAPLYSKPGTHVMVPVGHGGFPIGILDHAEYDASSLYLAPGSRLYLYSDGIPDCPNAQDELFGQERLKHLLMQKHGAPLVEVRDAIGNALSEWREGKEGFDDDITFLVLEYHAQTQNVQARSDSQSNCASPCSGEAVFRSSRSA